MPSNVSSSEDSSCNVAMSTATRELKAERTMRVGRGLESKNATGDASEMRTWPDSEYAVLEGADDGEHAWWAWVART